MTTTANIMMDREHCVAKTCIYFVARTRAQLAVETDDPSSLYLQFVTCRHSIAVSLKQYL